MFDCDVAVISVWSAGIVLWEEATHHCGFRYCLCLPPSVIDRP